jgi:hypothetical protein
MVDHEHPHIDVADLPDLPVVDHEHPQLDVSDPK